MDTVQKFLDYLENPLLVKALAAAIDGGTVNVNADDYDVCVSEGLLLQAQSVNDVPYFKPVFPPLVGWYLYSKLSKTTLAPESISWQLLEKLGRFAEYDYESDIGTSFEIQMDLLVQMRVLAKYALAQKDLSHTSVVPPDATIGMTLRDLLHLPATTTDVRALTVEQDLPALRTFIQLPVQLPLLKFDAKMSKLGAALESRGRMIVPNDKQNPGWDRILLADNLTVIRQDKMSTFGSTTELNVDDVAQSIVKTVVYHPDLRLLINGGQCVFVVMAFRPLAFGEDDMRKTVVKKVRMPVVVHLHHVAHIVYRFRRTLPHARRRR
jgi:hypothetical protein